MAVATAVVTAVVTATKLWAIQQSTIIKRAKAVKQMTEKFTQTRMINMARMIRMSIIRFKTTVVKKMIIGMKIL